MTQQEREFYIILACVVVGGYITCLLMTVLCAIAFNGGH